MTAKTLEKVPVNLGGFVHPDSVYSVDDISSNLPTSVAIFPNSELGAHYDPINVAGKRRGYLLLHFMFVRKKTNELFLCQDFELKLVSNTPEVEKNILKR